MSLISQVLMKIYNFPHFNQNQNIVIQFIKDAEYKILHNKEILCQYKRYNRACTK